MKTLTEQYKNELTADALIRHFLRRKLCLVLKDKREYTTADWKENRRLDAIIKGLQK
jgi:uncharacterized protein VirK/YbjX